MSITTPVLITPAEFIERWNSTADPEPLLRVDPEHIASRRIPDISWQFLVEAGLPADGAPFLGFYETGSGLPWLWNVFGQEKDWDDARKKPLYRYAMLGSDGAGYPICLDEEENGHILLLDFHDFHVDSFVNSSIPQLAEFLLLYREATATVNETADDDDTIDLATARREQQKLTAEFIRIDPPAMVEGAFWYHEAACFAANME